MDKQASPPSPSGKAVLNGRQRIEIELIQLMFGQSGIGIAATAVNGVIVAYIMRHQFERGIVIGWLVAIMTVTIIRLSLFISFQRRERIDAKVLVWGRWNIATLFLSGVLWGITPWILFPPESVAHQFFLVVVLCGMVAGASIAFAILNKAFLAFSVPTMLPLFVRLIIIPDELHLLMAAMSLFSWSLCYMIARNLRRTRMQLLRLKEDLSDRVAERTADLERANARLRAENEHRVRIEKALRKEHDLLEESKKFQAVATLAGGMAHQFNNALSVIMGNAELLQHDHGHKTDINRNIVPVLRAAKRMSDLTDQLLAYAKGGKYKAKPHDLKAFLSDTVAILEHTLPSGVKVITELDERPAFAKIDTTQMQMAITAIVANSAEALPSGGRIRVRCSRQQIGPSDGGQYGPLPPGDYLVLTVADDGAGMTRETLARIFEPFFTTKFQGRGLGMAAVYGIIENHGGSVSVTSQSGQGTKVSIYLPEAAPPEAPRPEGSPSTAKSHATVLLVEDEEMVIEINEAILERLGYAVLCARNGREAEEILIAKEPTIDLILLDIKLPDMDGSAIYPIAKQHRPNAKIVICSGYALDGPTQALMDQGADGFIHKPFSISVISDTIDRLLFGTESPEA